MGRLGCGTALLRYSPQFQRMFVEKLMTYAIGRGMEYTDMPTIRAIVRDTAKDNNRFSAIVAGRGQEPAVSDAREVGRTRLVATPLT